MTILICGAGGQVGQELVSRARHRTIVALDRARLDIADRPAVKHEFTRIRPMLVINAAAYTAVDKAESDAENAFRVNRDGPETLAEACQRAGIPLLHLSTDYVFDGTAGAPYPEDAPVNPLGVYGRSKWEGEEAIRRTLDRHLIIRVAWIFGAFGNNFVRTMLRLGRERPELRVVADQHGAPTHAGAIAEVMLSLSDKILAGQQPIWGTYHYTGTPVTTWYQFAQTVFTEAVQCQLLDAPPKLTAISTADYPTLARRPASSALADTWTGSRLEIVRQPWVDGLREVLHTWKSTSSL